MPFYPCRGFTLEIGILQQFTKDFFAFDCVVLALSPANSSRLYLRLSLSLFHCHFQFGLSFCNNNSCIVLCETEGPGFRGKRDDMYNTRGTYLGRGIYENRGTYSSRDTYSSRESFPDQGKCSTKYCNCHSDYDILPEGRRMIELVSS